MKKCMLFIIIITLSLNIYPLFHSNHISCVFNDGAEQCQVEEFVVMGCTAYLQSQSFSHQLMAEYEKSVIQPFNFALSYQLVQKALAELSQAIDSYEQALATGSGIEYKAIKVDSLRNLDLNTYRKDTHTTWNQQVLDQVMEYLSRGDVLGIYQEGIRQLKEIKKILERIQQDISNQKLPGIRAFWSLFQKYSEFNLFGNYATIVVTDLVPGCGEVNTIQ
jgi:hypothetical protein